MGGELSPGMWGRVTHEKYKFGASTMRNGFVNFQGGYASRAGLAYIGMCKQAAPNIGGATLNNISNGTPVNSGPPRPIPFQFSVLEGYDLEFGDYYMRVVYKGGYVTESSRIVTSVNSAGLFTIPFPHGFNVGDWIYNSGNTGFSGLTWVVLTVPSPTTFTVSDLFGNVISVATASGSGTVARIYTLTTPYAAVDLPYLKYVQSAAEMSLTCWNQKTLTEYTPYDLKRIASDNWTLAETSFSSSISSPTNCAATAQSSTTLNTWYAYVVTAVDAKTGTESIASNVAYIQNNDISVNAGTNTITWSPVAGASSYNIYQSTPYYSTGANVPQIGVSFGYIGTALGTSFVDSNIVADFTRTPPQANNPFAPGQIIDVTITAGGSGYTQAGVTYSVTSARGSGFVGTPIVLNGAVNGFYIQEAGIGYATGDTISFGGNGGTPGAKSVGSLTFSTNPSFLENIVLNGSTWTFVIGGASGNETNIQYSSDATVAQLAADLNASVDTNISAATYTASGSTLNIVYKIVGTVGNSYTLNAGTTFGCSISGSTLTGGVNSTGSSSAYATLSFSPLTGNNPGVVNYVQQRRAYASTQNNPDTYYLSQSGDYTNMNASIPTVASDAIIGTPWSQQVNGVQFLTLMPGGVVVFTGGGAWLLSGGTSNAITPADQSAQPQTRYGCSSTVAPLPINFHILFVRENNGVAYDLMFNFYAQVYTGTDLTIFSNHLFEGYEIVNWAYAEKPSKLVWAVRNDGVLLSMTYIAEQNEQGWARHDTNGLFINVCSIEEPPVDAVYVIVQRYVRGNWVYYHERFNNRIWDSTEETFCVDAGLSTPISYPNATLSAASATGGANITGVELIYGGTGYINPTAEAVDSSGNGTGATFTVTQSDGVITSIVPDTTGEKYVAGYTKIIINDPFGVGATASPIITNNVVFTASASMFNSGMVGDVIRMGNGVATITAYTSGTQVTANITQPITAIIPDDPNQTVIPAISGKWSLTTPVSVINGLNHLEGLTVTGLADGGVIVPTTVTNGSITLQAPASMVSVGLPYLPQLQLLYVELSTPGNTIQVKRKTIPSAGVRVHRTRGISIGSNQVDASTTPGRINVPWTNMVPVKELNQNVPMGTPIPLFTGDYFENIGSDWNIKGQIAIQQSFPLPMNVDACVSYMSLGDTPDEH